MLVTINSDMRVAYERIIKVGSRRVIPDFKVDSTYIECTRDPQSQRQGSKAERKVPTS
jgi:hypothetical protein